MRRMGLLLVIAISLLAVGCANKSGSRFEKAEKHLEAGHYLLAEREISSAVNESDRKFETVMTAVSLYAVHNRVSAEAELIDKLLNNPKKLISRNLEKWEETGLLTLLSNLRVQQGRLKDSVIPLERAFALSPDDPMIMNNLAYQYAEVGISLQKALVLARRAHSALPDKGIITDTLGWVHYKLDNKSEAVTFLRLAVKQNPELADLRYHLGSAYQASGSIESAYIEYKKALIIDPSLSTARKELWKLKKHSSLILKI